MEPMDLAYLLFGQAMPGLSIYDRSDINEWLNVSEYGSALLTLVACVDRDHIAVDAELLQQARASAAEYMGT